MISSLKSAALILPVTVLAARIAGGEPPPGVVQAKRDEGVEATVNVATRNLVGGTVIDIECLARNTGAAKEIYNGFLSDKFRMPATVLVISSDGTRRNVLGANGRQAKDGARESPWIYLRPGDAVGRKLTFSASQVGVSEQSTSVFSADGPIRAGNYYVQAVYNHWLTAGRPQIPGRLPAEDDEPQVKTGWPADRMARILAASEPVKLAVTPVPDREVPRHRAERETVHIELSPPSIRVKFGRRADIEIRMSNASDSAVELFNPLLPPLLLERAVVLAILAENGTYIGNLLEQTEGSQKAVSARDWITVPPDGILSTRFAFIAGDLPGLDFLTKLPPGKYFLELRVHGHFLCGRPWDFFQVEHERAVREAERSFRPDVKVETTGGNAVLQPRDDRPSYREWTLTFPGPEICRSNRVELEVLPRTGD